jgi:hypothetical protein
LPPHPTNFPGTVLPSLIICQATLDPIGFTFPQLFGRLYLCKQSHFWFVQCASYTIKGFKEIFTLATPFRGESSANYTLTTPFRLPPPGRKSEAIHTTFDYSSTLLIEPLSPCARRIICLPILPKFHPPKDNSLVLVGYLLIAP